MLHIRPDDDVDVYAADDDVDVDDSDQRGPREDDNPHGFLEYKNNGLRGFLWAPVICIVHSNDHDDDDADNVGDDDPYGAHSADAHLSLVSG